MPAHGSPTNVFFTPNRPHKALFANDRPPEEFFAHDRPRDVFFADDRSPMLLFVHDLFFVRHRVLGIFSAHDSPPNGFCAQLSAQVLFAHDRPFNVLIKKKK